MDEECFLGADGGEYCVVEPEFLAGAQGPAVTGEGTRGEPAAAEVAASSAAVGGAAGVAIGEGGVFHAGSLLSAKDSSGALSLYAMMSMCFLVAVVCALDRVAMSVAIVPMSQAYGYSDTTKGLISSVFSWGYMVSMVPSSVLIGVLGPKATMAGGVLAWSAAQMLSPAAASASLGTLLACRFAMGVGEAVTVPTIQAIVAEWVPQDQRSRWLSLIISGLQVGTVLAYLASPWIIDTWRWERVFVAYGAIGLAWLALWVPAVPSRAPAALAAAVSAVAERQDASRRRDQGDPVRLVEERSGKVLPSTPESEVSSGRGSLSYVPAGESSYGSGVDEPRAALAVPGNGVEAEAGGRESAGGVVGGFRDIPWKAYATSGQVWSITAAHMAHNWGLYVMLAWLPTYFNQEFDLSLGQSSGASLVPWVAGAVTGNMAGWAADALVNEGILDLRAVRKLFQSVALVGPAACMLALAQGPETSAVASTLFTVAVALGSCSSAGFGSSVQDLKSRHTGVIYGLTSACSAVWGSVGTFLTGVVLDTTDSWALVFQSTAAVYVLGALIYGSVYRAEPMVLGKR